MAIGAHAVGNAEDRGDYDECRGFPSADPILTTRLEVWPTEVAAGTS